MNQAKVILVIGGTGMLGKPVAQHLKSDGYRVRILARSPEKSRTILGDGFDFFPGDVEDAPSLHKALSGVDGVHINLKGGPSKSDFYRMDHLATQRIALAAKEESVGRVTIIAAYASGKEKADTPESRAKFAGIEALKSSGVPYTVFRCSWFMESLPLFIQGKNMSLIGNQIHPLHWIAAEDYARMVSRSYLTDETLNRELYIYGPEEYTMAQAMKMYTEIAAPKTKVTPISTQMLSIMGALTLNKEWNSMATLMGHYERWGEDGSPEEANRLLGAPEIKLNEWCSMVRSQKGQTPVF